MIMAGHIGGQPLFTIEQIELLRRLRNSGITKEQIIQAFDSMDRMDRELGPVYTIPVSLAALAQHDMARLAASAAGNAAVSMAASTGAGLQTQAFIAARKRLYEAAENGDITPCKTFIELVDAEGDSEEIREFQSKGEAACCEEIRNFVVCHNIKQHQIATVTGLSQAYISRYLRADYYDMSDRCKRAIWKWYLTCKRTAPTEDCAMNLVSSPPTPTTASVTSNTVTPAKRIVQLDTNGAAVDLLSYPRRERFTFRPAHLEVLERCFAEENYPSQERREDIARTCNAVMETPGRVLSEKEKVTPTIVSNWFSNKRKEMKRLLKEEGLDPSLMNLRCRGRPPLSVSVSNDHSHDYTVIQSPGTPGSNQSADQNSLPGASTDSQSEQQTSQPGENNSQSQNKQSTTSEDTDDQSLALAVEMAAVNQAIVALSGQNRMPNIKTEKADEV